MKTQLYPEKILCQQQGFLWDKTTPVIGYEIHCGVSEGEALKSPAIYFGSGTSDGALSEDGQVLGTYLHGLFDSPDASKMLLQWCGVEVNEIIAIDELRERELNRLANEVEIAMNLDFLNIPVK